ncbi:MAG: RNA-guided pseudouridylation complex pseudouridine synthase subunit Cbf5 [Thaumarchaeota archaeon]|nr:RNA-guided pseudouridylation complex pseudouridine synthase subunit Cbf5 [Nitrososphaerota archaeon]
MVPIAEEATDSGHGSEPSQRPIDSYINYGLIPLDKTRGPTSHEVVAWVRKLMGVQRAGHSGTLDPGVSGVLPIGLGKATKALSLLLIPPKEYIAVMRIHSSVPREQVDRVVREFTGEIFQKPPQRSSVKREVRTRTIYELEVLEQAGNLFLIRVLCQSGTYIRKLIYDMGEVLLVGATMVELRRTRVGPITEWPSREGDIGPLVTLHDLNDAVHRWKHEGDESRIRALVRPIESCMTGMKRVIIKDAAVDAVCHGAMLAVPGILSLSPGIKKGETVVLLSGKGELVAIAEAGMTTDEIVGSKKGIAFPVKRVIMEAGTYPKLWKTQKHPPVDEEDDSAEVEVDEQD